jgi:hypothetical protein
MWIDSRLEFSDAQLVTSTADSTNSVDLSVNRLIGNGHPLYVVITVDTAVTGTAPTVTAVLETDSTSDFATAPRAIATFPVINDTNGVAGATFFVAVPNDNDQFLQIQYTAGGTVSTGNVSCWLTHEQPVSSQVTSPDAVN